MEFVFEKQLLILILNTNNSIWTNLISNSLENLFKFVSYFIFICLIFNYGNWKLVLKNEKIRKFATQTTTRLSKRSVYFPTF